MVADVTASARPLTAENAYHPHRVAVLEWIAAGIVTLGGSALSFPLTQGIVTGLGLIHLILGLTGFPAGYGLWSGKVWGRSAVLTLNSVTIAWSVFSEMLLVFFLATDDRLYGSIGGTLVYIAIAATVIYLLFRSPALDLPPKA